VKLDKYAQECSRSDIEDPILKHNLAQTFVRSFYIPGLIPGLVVPSTTSTNSRARSKFCLDKVVFLIDLIALIDDNLQ